MANKDIIKSPIATRFRGFLPVVVDVETSGLNADTDALLEIAMVLLTINEYNQWCIDEILSKHIEPFEGANMSEKSLAFTGIDPNHPFRKEIAISEHIALKELFDCVYDKLDLNHCTRAILVGHNAAFDLAFLNAGISRNKIKKNPFHKFSILDTVSLSGLVYKQTVLSRSVCAAGLDWDQEQAHSAYYDAERTAELFCQIVNLWDSYQKDP